MPLTTRMLRDTQSCHGVSFSLLHWLGFASRTSAERQVRTLSSASSSSNGKAAAPATHIEVSPSGAQVAAGYADGVVSRERCGLLSFSLVLLKKEPYRALASVSGAVVEPCERGVRGDARRAQGVARHPLLALVFLAILACQGV